ncbi:plasminogen-like [Aplysia californica]|uniref:Plasminogen-like n=1 Tax=Aplysia californica TaxID=6500 RepID=A0ABM0JSA2_APLCA|nr:plasminogen-like [Aplysia californica]
MECLTKGPESYRGILSFSVLGNKCDYWKDYFSDDDYLNFGFGGTVHNARNYCRGFPRPYNNSEISNNDDRPWCYVNGVVESCGVNTCLALPLRIYFQVDTCIPPWNTDGTDYQGYLDFVMTNRGNRLSCDPWYSQGDFSMSGACPMAWVQLFPSRNSSHNYCRNPDRRYELAP